MHLSFSLSSQFQFQQLIYLVYELANELDFSGSHHRYCRQEQVESSSFAGELDFYNMNLACL